MYLLWIIAIGLWFNPNSCSADEPIKYEYIDYSKWRKLGVNWSTTLKENDWDTKYTVLDYTLYADTFDKFIQKYPYFTIETSGQAVAECCIGDVGNGQFGTKTYSTFNFKDIRENKYLVASWKNHAYWEVWVNIGLGFQKKDGKLHVFPFYDCGIYGAGASWRYLNFGLSVGVITFYPKDYSVQLIV